MSDDDDPWDPRAVSWQGRPGEPPSLLWRVEVARRNLRAARQRTAETVALQNRLDEERAEAARRAAEEKAYWASPAGQAARAAAEAAQAAQAARDAAAAEREARLEARLPILKAEHEARAKRQAEMQPVFDEAGGRGRWCLIERRKGRTFSAIGREGGLSPERVRQICAKEERLERRRSKWWHNRVWSRAEVNRGRPIDMGGPREIWLTYAAPADPRLDNMWPVT